MCYIRGNPVDYDRWATKTGYEKFGWDNVLPVFKMSQNAHGYGNDEYNGREGELDTSKGDMSKIIYGDLSNAWVEAGVQAGTI